ncbi:histidine kinase [Massilia sp. KIM]|uniref:HDOD domain-containing protein n=1 Tax=Massilia sp. KIM TaxID=1955422 RepID=UPI00098EE7AA|nr:HDOD domain-containing protein [Massilia sp. KIM]OON62818.1 histidine kinase [Massilia sp. KIM]
MTALSDFFHDLKLPTISQVAHSLIATLDDEDASARSVAAIIARDPALTAKLMRLANSARFGSRGHVATLDEAIALAGMGHIRTLALAACFADAFPELPGLDSDEFWKSSMACAGYAKWLAGGLGIDGSEAWLAGMMLRLGELLIYQVSPSTFAEIEQQPHLPGGRWEREQRLLGLSEGQITAELGRRWNFPAKLVRALECSSDPLAAHPFCQLAGVIHLASLLADTPSDDPAIVDELPQDLLDTLRLRKEWMQARFPAHESFAAAA